MMIRHAAFVCLVMLSPAAMADTLEQRNRANTYMPPPAKEGFSYPDCYCTDSDGRRVEKGETACLRIGPDQFTARCDMSLNNPIWRRESEGCPGV